MTITNGISFLFAAGVVLYIGWIIEQESKKRKHRNKRKH